MAVRRRPADRRRDARGENRGASADRASRRPLRPGPRPMHPRLDDPETFGALASPTLTWRPALTASAHPLSSRRANRCHESAHPHTLRGAPAVGERDKPWEADRQWRRAGRRRNRVARGSAAVGVDRRGGRGYGVEGRLGVDPEAAEAGVAALGEQDRQLDAVLGEVGEPGVAQLVERPAARGC